MKTLEPTDALLVEAARWRLLGLLFERPRPGRHAELRSLAAEVGDDRLEAAVGASGDCDEGGYLAVFGPGGAVSPREAAYRPMGDPGRILAELRGFYDAFGYAPRVEDPPDHVAVEVGFVGFMKLKQAYAAARGDVAAQRAARQAVATFVDEHLAGFAGEMARRLKHVSPHPLERAGSILDDWCPGTSREPLQVVNREASTPPDDDGLSCGADCGD